MPTEMRFDELDLREEPERGDTNVPLPSGGISNPCNTRGGYCTEACTGSCCTTC